MQVRKGLCIFSIAMGILLSLVTEECLSDLVEIYGNQVSLARDMGSCQMVV